MPERWCGEPMKSYAAVAGLVFAAFFVLFLLGEVASVPPLTDPSPWLHGAGVPPALLGVGVLMADAVLPVPSSLVMIVHGTVFGVGLGTLLSVVGGTGATAIGFALGRRGGPLLARFVSPQERATADRLLERWGAMAIVVTRPVPLLAETVAVLAGASPLGWKRATLAALIGTFPAALIYALTGAAVVRLGSGALLIGATVAIVGCTWLVVRHLARRLAQGRDRKLTQMVAGTSP
jgi:uncharacterized membrane protein YdjX (TVP38/TMEM64 family)